MFYFKRTSPCLIGWESSTSFLHQSQSEARKTKLSRNTCHTQLKVAINKQSDVSSPLQSCYSDEPDGLQWLLQRRVSRWPIWWWKEKEWKIKDMISYFSWLHAYIDYFIRRPISISTTHDALIFDPGMMHMKALCRVKQPHSQSPLSSSFVKGPWWQLVT